MGRIVVGVDGSKASKAALRWAVRQAQCCGDSLDVVLAWDNPYRDMWLPHITPSGEPLGRLRHNLQRTVEAALGDPPLVDAATSVVEGHPADALLLAAKGADLLVVGNRGRSGLTGAILGSVSLHCASRAPCPVVIVRDGESVD